MQAPGSFVIKSSPGHVVDERVFVASAAKDRVGTEDRDPSSGVVKEMIMDWLQRDNLERLNSGDIGEIIREYRQKNKNPLATP